MAYPLIKHIQKNNIVIFCCGTTLIGITYHSLYNQLLSCEEAELAMPVQALYFGTVWKAIDLRYTWTADGTLLLSLESEKHSTSTLPLTYLDLLCQLRGMCPWQLELEMIIGMDQELTEVLTLYHEFDYAPRLDASLMLIVTPPDAYFERQAA